MRFKSLALAGLFCGLQCAALFLPAPGHAARLKDIARIDVAGDLQLVGYGLVIGLGGTGDSQVSEITRQSMGNVLEHMGINVDDRKLRLRNAASVMVVARIGRYHRRGATIDVSVSSLGDAKSLEGGTLMMTALATPDGVVHVTAQGPVSVGGFSVRGAASNRSQQNYVLSGRVPGGGIIERELQGPAPSHITIQLNSPDYTTAQRVANAINQRAGETTAHAVDAATVTIDADKITGDSSNPAADRVAVLYNIESIEVEVDAPARVVVNERTGTLVAGENVGISAVAIAHGNLSVEVRSNQVISQPAAFSEVGETRTVEATDIGVYPGDGGLHAVPATASVGDLARALNALGVTPRDLIAIFQALKEAGALYAELRVI